MSIAMTVRRALPLFVLAPAAGCQADGASEQPVFEEPAATMAATAPPDGALAVDPLAPALPPSPPLLGSELEPPANDPAASCVTARAAVELVRQPVDIIIALDNSGSMDDEARAVESNINDNFANILEQAHVDYRMILVSAHRERESQDTAVCITAPLSALAACPAELPGMTERFFHYSTRIGSGNSFDVLLESFGGEREDDFGLAPPGWSAWLRPGAKKVFLEISDDNANSSATEFLSALTARAPEHFGPAPNQLQFVWHSIVGLAERSVPSEPYGPIDPIEARECAGNVFNAGRTYQELSRLTGGLRFPICAFDGYDAIFRRIAEDVAEAGGVACDFAIPEPPEGRILNLDEVAVAYQPGSGGAQQRLGRVSDTALCGADSFLVDDTGVRLCPAACDIVKADSLGFVDVLFTCEDTLLR